MMMTVEVVMVSMVIIMTILHNNIFYDDDNDGDDDYKVRCFRRLGDISVACVLHSPPLLAEINWSQFK